MNKREGKEDAVVHKESLTAEDWDRLQTYFTDVETSNDPVLLARYVWFTVTSQFCLRGREVQAQMCKSDLSFQTDDCGKPYITLSKDFASKNHQGGLDGSAFTSAGRIQDETQVKVLQRYLKIINPNCERLFQRANLSRSGTDKVCLFMNMPLSHNLLGTMMAKISEAASLSRTYTNHCVRATAIWRMKANNVDDRKICSVSGHKSASSLQSYDRVSNSDAKAMSSAISGNSVASSKVDCPAESLPLAVSSPEPDVDLPCVDDKKSQAGFVLKDCQNITFNVQNSWLQPRKRSYPFSLKLNKKARK
ncbi:uncharacterized protein LOC135813677 [Sycon ciliatum]|uniref:uncharacterized protein LOC135813677 n=1 Tax=Sycon ciliatum TaxID=27933 RepID=UPI0031F713E9